MYRALKTTVAQSSQMMLSFRTASEQSLALPHHGTGKGLIMAPNFRHLPRKNQPCNVKEPIFQAENTLISQLARTVLLLQREKTVWCKRELGIRAQSNSSESYSEEQCLGMERLIFLSSSSTPCQADLSWVPVQRFVYNYWGCGAQSGLQHQARCLAHLWHEGRKEELKEAAAKELESFLSSAEREKSWGSRKLNFNKLRKVNPRHHYFPVSVNFHLCLALDRRK